MILCVIIILSPKLEVITPHMSLHSVGDILYDSWVYPINNCVAIFDFYHVLISFNDKNMLA